MPLGRFLPPAILTIAFLVLAVALLSGAHMVAVATLAVAGTTIFLELVAIYPMRRDIERIRRHVGQLANEDQADPTPPVSRWTGTSDLWHQIRRLYDANAARQARLDAELGKATAVLAYFPDPVLLVDRFRIVVQANSAAVELLGDHLTGRDLAAAIRNPAVLNATDAVLAGKGPLLIEFEMSAPVERSIRARIDLVAGDRPVALLALTDFTTLKRAEQLRSDFVANASHELRTPLSTVVGFIETLEGPAANDEEARRRFLPIMRQQAARMARLVDDLLSLSRIELNEHLPPRGRVNVAAVLPGLMQALEIKAGARSMRLVLVEETPAPLVTGDAEELSQVFQNLIDNAIKYGNQGSIVEITVRASSRFRDGLSVSVRDQGEGIARPHLPRLTERFYRVDTARSRAMGGTGLGLAIVKHIINRHRGILEIESEVGVGSVFTVHLPSLPQRAADPTMFVADSASDAA